jgi:Bacterial mobilisation protein (MobC)
MKPVQLHFRAARLLCARPGATLPNMVIALPLQTVMPEPSKAGAEKLPELPDTVLPDGKNSFAQVAGLVAPSVAPNPVGGLKPGGDTKDGGPIQQSPNGEMRKRPNPLSVRFSAVEIGIVKSKARTAGCSTNSYIRAAALGSSYRPPCDTELKRILLGLARELTAQGNNLNQVARRLNAGIAPAMHGATLEALTSSIKETLQHVRAALARGGQAA